MYIGDHNPKNIISNIPISPIIKSGIYNLVFTYNIPYFIIPYFMIYIYIYIYIYMVLFWVKLYNSNCTLNTICGPIYIIFPTGSSYTKGEEIFLTLRALQEDMSNNIFTGNSGMRYQGFCHRTSNYYPVSISFIQSSIEAMHNSA